MAPTAVSRTAVVVVLGLEVATFVALVASDVHLATSGHAELRQLHGATWVVTAAIGSAAATGGFLAWARPAHPVGWLFLALAASLLLSGVIDEYAAARLLVAHDPSGRARLAAVAGDVSFAPWLVLVALVLHLTPTGHTLGPRWRALARHTVAAGAVYLACSLVGTRQLEAPYRAVENPWALPSLAPVLDPLRVVAILAVGVGLIGAAASLLVRFRRSSADERRPLLWLALVVVPLPLFVVVSFASSMTGHDSVLIWATGGFIVLVPAAAGLSVLRFQLYEVERVLTRAVVYGILSALVVLVYAAVVLLATRGLGTWSGSGELAATLGATAAALVALPLRDWLQDQVARRFDRQRHRAERVAREGLAAAPTGVDLDALLARALADPTAHAVFADEESGGWIRADGRPAEAGATAADAVRHGRAVARVVYDPATVDERTARAVTSIVAGELDNVRLRAELARRLEEVSASRHRLLEAQHEERRRIGRDLHDGAQQSLLAIAFELRAAELNGDPDRMRSALAGGVVSVGKAVRELRALADGLLPSTLADGGVEAALEELARHSPVPVSVSVRTPPLQPAVAFTVWMIACEAVVNARRHASATAIELSVEASGDGVVVAVGDDGCGGADPEGLGLRGLRDRVATAAGTWDLRSPAGGGTRLRVWLPAGPAAPLDGVA
ncbi:histidine kinase [Nocardioides sp. LS1]|uniref:sensor histidine kinase n=1 Tax=Nocardioides sp. LS1 TaxID=1027620 RepID=UPI000F61F9F7|nr:histidine kinase [Nocardioides sp. LS1]GCD89820.1 hypothetical protein NLS1_18260 [Nocardioides sp. LS1]